MRNSHYLPKPVTNITNIRANKYLKTINKSNIYIINKLVPMNTCINKRMSPYAIYGKQRRQSSFVMK